MMQAPEPMAMEVVTQLLKYVGAPAFTALGFIWLFRKVILPKANGKQAEEQTKEILYKLDAALTDHFDQLRRDLETKIEKTMENRLTAYLFQSELERQTTKKAPR